MRRLQSWLRSSKERLQRPAWIADSELTAVIRQFHETACGAYAGSAGLLEVIG